MSTTSIIQASAEKHADLLREIANLDYAPSALEQSSAYVQDLTQQKANAQKQLDKLTKEMTREREEHLDLQRSVTRKWANKLVGRGDKFAERATKEEREYLEAVEREMEQRSRVERLSLDLDEATQMNQDLKHACEQREKLQRDVVELYNSIFAGPTPEFPHEDQLEHVLRTAQDANDRAQSKLNNEAQTLGLLSNAGQLVQQCVDKMADARLYSGDDVWGFGGRGADVMESNSLTAAQMLATQADMLIDQARRLNPAVAEVPSVRIPQTSMTDIYFDNIFTDLEMHDKIKAAQQAVLKVQAKLREVICAAEARVDVEATEASITAEVLVKSRRELYELRQATFISISERGAPPAFQDSHVSNSAEVPVSRSGSTISMPNPEPSRPTGPAGWSSMNPYAALLAGKRQHNEGNQPL